MGVPISFRVGPTDAVYGDDLARLDGPWLANGYLPIIEMSYREGDATYRQEAFVSVEPSMANHGVLFVRFALDAGREGMVSAHVTAPESLRLNGHQLCNDSHQVFVCAGSNWQWDPARQTLAATLAPGGEAVLAVFTDAAPKLATTASLSGNEYRNQRQRCVTTWQRLLGKGVNLDVPETVVNNAWRAVLGANFTVVTGNTVNYSAGNDYLKEYITEGSRTVGAFMLFGFTDESPPMLLSLLDHSIPEHIYAVTSWKMRALTQ
ncbi:MAG: hypothetical protein WC655_15525, partial [Candidatus Hydrogenedentales bacterium]